MSKPELRRAMRRARTAYAASLTGSERLAMEARLAGLLWPLVSKAGSVAIYSPIGSEIDVTPLSHRHDSPTTAYPAFASKDSPMVFRAGQCAEDGPFGGAQPRRDAMEIEPELVLVPLLAIDPRGHRLGQGGGHYDRALPGLRAAGATLVGAGWPMQQLDFELPADPWDVPLDGFASPAGIEWFR